MKYIGRRRRGDRLHEQRADRILCVAARQFSDVEPEPAAPHECAASWFIGDGLIRLTKKSIQMQPPGDPRMRSEWMPTLDVLHLGIAGFFWWLMEKLI